jgi:hypothetical protein
MTRRKPSLKTSEPILDLDRDEFAAGRPLNRKQVQDMIRKKESFIEADLRGCDLNGICFDNQDLSFAKLAEANLSRCTFRNARLNGTSFFAANLKDAILEDCDMEEADLDYAWLDGVSLRGAKIKKAIFPYKKVPVSEIKESVKTGKRLRMEPMSIDEDE